MKLKRSVACFAVVLACLLLSAAAMSEVVDPCGYGCPKSGCPNCPEGGPINNSTARGITISVDSCKDGCKRQLRDQVRLCDTLYPPSSQSENHTQCLSDARDEYDSCMATCQ